MSIIFLQYTKCSTCKKAGKWLSDNKITVISRDIVTQNPQKNELNEWFKKSGLSITKFFNTSGKVYKENNIKDAVKVEPVDKLLELLSSNGMLVKRPILILEDFVLVGFNEEQWKSKLLKD